MAGQNRIVPVSGVFMGYFKTPDGTYAPVGHTDKDGFLLRMRIHGQELQTAYSGDMVPDGIYTGKSATIHMTLLEVGETAVRKMLAAETVVGQTVDEGLIHSDLAPMGRNWSQFAGAFKLLPLPGVPATNFNSPSIGNGMEFSKVMVMNEQDIEHKLNSYARTIPIVLRVLPYRSTVGSQVQLRNWKWVNEFANVSDFNFTSAPA